MYFYWDRRIPSCECATTIPRKNFICPRFFIVISLISPFGNLNLSSWSLLLMMLSSRYTAKIVTFLVFECLKTRYDLHLIEDILFFFMTSKNLLNHARGDCFSPYNTFFNLHRSLFLNFTLNPGQIRSLETQGESKVEKKKILPQIWWLEKKKHNGNVNTLPFSADRGFGAPKTMQIENYPEEDKVPRYADWELTRKTTI